MLTKGLPMAIAVHASSPAKAKSGYHAWERNYGTLPQKRMPALYAPSPSPTCCLSPIPPIFSYEAHTALRTYDGQCY